MENLLQEQRCIEREISEEIDELNRLNKERSQRIERIYELHEKWRDIERVLEEENRMKGSNISKNNKRDTESDNEVTEEEEDKLEKNGKRKRTEESMYEWIREKRKKRRREKFDEELINEGIDEETDQKAETSELIHLYIKSVRKENEKNKRVIEHWNHFAKRYEERITEKIEDRKEMGEMTTRMAAREVNDELRRGLPEGYRKKLNKNIETARKARYVIQEIGIKRLGGVSLDTLRKTSWNEIKRKICEVQMKDNEGKIVEIQERNIMKIMN